MKLTGNYKHGHGRGSRAYYCWRNMLNRCQNPKVKSFKDYGAKGITVCSRWWDFRNFLADMGEPPPGMTIDRIENHKGYFKGNCRWATRLQQLQNKSNKITFRGRTQTLRAWAKELGIKETTIWMRLNAYGWPIERAFQCA